MALYENIDGAMAALHDVLAWQDRNRRADHAAATYDDFAVERLGTFARLYPMVPSGILRSFVDEGLAYDAPEVRAVTALNYNRQAMNGGPKGTIQNAAFFRRNHARRKLSEVDSPMDINVPVEQFRAQDPKYRELNPGQRRLLRHEGYAPTDIVDALRVRGMVDEETGMLIAPVEDPWSYVNSKGDFIPGKLYELPAVKREDVKTFVTAVTQASLGTGNDIFFLDPNRKSDQVRRYVTTSPTGVMFNHDIPVEQGAETVPFKDILVGMTYDSVDGLLSNTRSPFDWRMPDSRSFKAKGKSISAPSSVQQSGLAGNLGSVADVVRTAGMAADALGQEAQGVVRKTYEATHGGNPNWFESQSNFGISISHPDASQGEGFFVDPESEVARERLRREQENGLLGGHTVTAGRWAADALPLTTDSKPYTLLSGSVDFAAQVFDPAWLAARGVSKVSAARRLLEPEEVTGAFSGVRRFFHGPTYNAFEQTEEGQRFLTTIADASGDASSPYEIWKASNRKLDPEMALELYNRETPESVSDYMRQVAGSRLRNIRTIENINAELGPETMDLFRNIHSNRLVRRIKDDFLPSYHIDSTNKLDAAVNMEDFLRLAKVDESVKADVFNMIAESQTRNGVEQAVEHGMTATGGVLERAGVESVQQRRMLTAMFSQARERAINALKDEIESDTPIRDAVMANRIRIQDMSPHLTIEYLERYIPLPDITRIQRVLHDPKYRWLTTNMKGSSIGKPRLPEAALNGFIDNLWKPGQLLGRFPAWITRVVGEEQIRLAYSGLHSMANHPLSAVAIMIGGSDPESRWGQWIVDNFGKIKNTPTGDVFRELQDHESAISRMNDGNLRRPGSTRSVPIPYFRDNLDQFDDFNVSWADQIAMRHYDPVARYYLENGIDETIDWLKNGKGGIQYTKLREAEPHMFAAKTDDEIRRYLTDVIGEDVRILTNGNEELINVMRNGVMPDGTSIFKKGGPKLNPKFTEYVKQFRDLHAPSVVKGYEPLSQNALDRYRGVLNTLFGATMSKVTDVASRSTGFRQLLWQETADLLPYVRYDKVQEILAAAEAADLPNNLMRRLRRQALRKGEQQIDSVEELQHLAGGYALDRTKELLYDAAKRGQLAQQFSILSPFINAWQEFFVTWGKMIAGPQVGAAGKAANAARVAIRVNQVVQGGIDSGVIRKNQFGENVFVFPFSQGFMKQNTGVPVPMTGRIQGLSMMADVFPGLGPAAAIPVGWMLDGKPGTWKSIQDAFLPYGYPGERDPNAAFNLMSIAPSWMQKMLMAMSAGAPPLENLPGVRSIPGIENVDEFVDKLWPSKDEVLWDNNAFMNAQKSVIMYNLSTGEYDTSTREGMQKLLEDSREQAKDIYYFRAAMQFFSPTAPSPEFLVQDKSGQLIAQWVVTEEYYNLVGEGASLDEASESILQKYGPNVLSLTIPKSRSVTYAIPRTQEAADWLNANPEVRTKYPDTYGFFAPQGGTVDYSILVDQMHAGQVDVLTPSEWLNLRNETMKNLEYNYYVDQVGPNPNDEQEAWLRQIRSDIEEDYPVSTAGIGSKPDNEEIIREFYDTLDDPALADNPAMQPLKEYLYYRDQAQAYATSAGYAGFSKPQAFYDTRVWLSDIAKDIMNDYPEFELMWTNVFSREFEKDLR